MFSIAESRSPALLHAVAGPPRGGSNELNGRICSMNFLNVLCSRLEPTIAGILFDIQFFKNVPKEDFESSQTNLLARIASTAVLF